MILKRQLEWSSSSRGGRKAELPLAPDPARRLLAFSNLSFPEGISVGALQFKGGSFSFYEAPEALSIEAGGQAAFEEALLVFESEKLLEGAEVFSPLDFLPLDVSYKVSYSADGSEASISGTVEVVSFRTGVAFASLSVDGFELLPSARLPLSKGLTVAELKPVKLIRRAGFWGENAIDESSYQMELTLGVSAELVVMDRRELRLWGVRG